MQALIEQFMKTFYGYGNLNGKYWFIGMEEGCGPNWQADVLPRFVQWDKRGRSEIENLRNFHFDIGITQHWEPVDGRPIKLQLTWKRLIETILTANGKLHAREDIVDYQSQHLGTLEGDICLLELLPLPSPKVREFGYAHLANEQYPYFASRALYKNYIMAQRIARIREMIAERQPRHIILYGTSYVRQWSNLVMNAEWKQIDNQIRCCKYLESQVWLVPHPAARNIPNNLFVTLGENIRNVDEQGNQQK